jgi:hypothetical protein
MLRFELKPPASTIVNRKRHQVIDMTNEEFEKRMEFILDQQAQFTADMHQLREAQAQTDQVVAQTVEIMGRFANRTLEGFNEVNAKIHALVDSQMRTEENLRNLTAVVDRYFSEGRNGKDPAS